MDRVHTVLLAFPGKWAGLTADPSVDGISSPCPPHHRMLNVSLRGLSLGFRAMSLWFRSSLHAETAVELSHSLARAISPSPTPAQPSGIPTEHHTLPGCVPWTS